MQPAKKQKATPRADRRASFAAYIYLRTGIDESMIERLINSFYARIRTDQVLGPIFAACIQDWPPPAVAEIVADYLDHGREIPHALAPREA
jgi:hypothetical protein